MCSLIEDHQSKVVTEVLGHDVNAFISKYSLKRECSYTSFILTLEKCPLSRMKHKSKHYFDVDT